MSKVVIALEDLVVRYGELTAVEGLSLQVSEGDFVTLLGPSGCGKTTTLKVIAGYVAPTSGRVRIDDKDVTRLPPQQRNIGMVFQNYALFPHMSVTENIAFGLRMRKWPHERIRDRVRELLNIVRLEGFGQARPRQLSGGMQQRVAVARALAFQPRILLMDEPLASLDAKLRKAMQLELKRIQRELGVTTIYVTHDQEEALSLSDWMVVMNRGRMIQMGRPEEVYRQPRSSFVADFVGIINMLEGAVESSDGLESRCRIGNTLVAVRSLKLPVARQVRLGLRPEDVTLQPAGVQFPAGNAFQATVKTWVFRGSSALVTVDVPDLGCELIAETRGASWAEGQAVMLWWDPTAMMPIVVD